MLGITYIGIILTIIGIAFLYGVVGCATVLLIVAVLRDYETFEKVEMPYSFEWAVITWPYRVYLCFEAWANRNGTEETNDLKKNPLD